MILRGKRLILLMVLGLFLAPAANADTSAREAYELAKQIPIQHNGRIKPLDSFARQVTKLITHKEKWKKPAFRLSLELLADPKLAKSWDWIRIDSIELKRFLSLNTNGFYFNYHQIEPSYAAIEKLLASSKEKRDKDLRPSHLEQKAEELYTKLRTLERLASGEAWAVIPSPTGSSWLSPFQASPPQMPRFQDIPKNLLSDKSTDALSLTQKWLAAVRPYCSNTHLVWEIRYHLLKPFEWAMVFYFLVFFISIFWAGPKSWVVQLTFFVFGAFFHTAGLVLRVFILSRPPVSNMYESMIFMNWALVVFAIVFAWNQKNSLSIRMGSIASALVMLYANLLPIDSSLEVLVPVLRSNYWLTIHVMTIVASYGAFGLAMALGHRQIILGWMNRLKPNDEKESADLIFKIIQLGTLMIGIGTVLGGVWANESWGRFWGWDPKETWALITFLGYLLVVHLKYRHKISDFGIALGSILGFFLVLMTWYGVNFVLGRGLHSYGRGAGGMQWVIYFLTIETLLIIQAIRLRPKKRTR